MPGLVPGTHVLLASPKEDVEGRDDSRIKSGDGHESGEDITMTYASEAGDFAVALGGDCMLTRRLAVYDEPAFLALAQVFRGCDAGFVNLETVVRRWHEGAPGITRGTYMTTPPELLDDLK